MSPALRRLLRPSLRLILLYVALGSAFLPGVLVSAVFTLTHGQIAQGPLVRMLGASEEVNRAVELDGRGRLVAKKGYASPAWLDLVVTDRRGIVVFSTIASLEPGSKPSLVDVAAFAGELVPKATFFSDKVEIGKVDAGTWYAILPSDSARSLAGETIPLMRFAGLGVFALIAFVFSFVVAAALAAHMGRLEKAAIAIAAGDLDSPIDTRGPREIVALSEAMESMRAAIREDQARRARFLAAVSHDLRTPLTSIGGYLEAIEDGLASDPATLGHYVATMRERTRALEERIEGLIDFARMESGEWRLRFESLSLSALFGGLASFAREEAALAGVSFGEELGAIGDLEQDVDKALLGRAFENLVANALAHGRPGGSLLVGSRRFVDARGRHFLAIDVDDDGPGIPEAQRGRAFEAFWRGSPSGGRGSGLGLYIARSIVEGHGWRLELSDSAQGGARFSIVIPVEDAAGKEARP